MAVAQRITRREAWWRHDPPQQGWLSATVPPAAPPGVDALWPAQAPRGPLSLPLRRKADIWDDTRRLGWLTTNLPHHLTLALVAQDAVLTILLHQPALAAPAAWLAAAAHPATLAEETGAYQPVLLVDFPTFSRTFSTHPQLFGTEEPRLARLAEGGVGAVSRDLDELDGGARLGGCSVALVSDAGFIETFMSAPLLNTPVHLRLGFVGLPEAQFLRVWTGVIDRYQFTHQRLEFSLIDASVKDNVNLNVPIGGDRFPNAPSESRGLNVPIFLGVHVNGPTIQVSGVAATGTLSFAMDGSSTTVVFLEDTASFPLASQVTVGSESITYTIRTPINISGITYVELSGLTRAAPVAHSVGAVVTLRDLHPSYLTGFGVDRVNAVRLNGVALTTSQFTLTQLQVLGHSVPVVTLLFVPADDTVVTVDVNATAPLLVMVVPDPPFDSTDQVVNGDFETGDTTGWTTTAGALTVGTGATPQVLVGPERVINGGFESGDLTSWTASGPGVSVGGATPAPQAGTYRLSIQPDFGVVSTRFVLQDLVTVPFLETFYSYGYQNDASAGPGDTDSRAEVTFGRPTQSGAYGVSFPALAAGVWNTETGSFTPTTATTRVQLGANSSAASEYATAFDSVTMHQEALVHSEPFEGAMRGELRGGLATDGVAYVEIAAVVGRTYQYHVAYMNPYNALADESDASTSRLWLGTPADPDAFLDLPLSVVMGAQFEAQWTTVTGFVEATDTTLRLTVRSQYADTPLSSYFDAVRLLPVATVTEPAPGDPVGLYTNGGENPVDAIAYMLDLFYPTATRDATAFLTARGLLIGMRFRGYLTNPGDSGTLLQRMGAQCKSLVQRNPMGEYTITVLDSSRPVAAAFTPANIVIETFQRASVPIDALYTSVYVYFDTFVGGSTSSGDYARVIYATPTATTAPDGAALVAACLEAQTLYGRDHRLDIYADFIRDIDTAHQLLAWLVSRHAVRQDELTWRAWLDAVPLQLGQVASLSHPVLANALAVVSTELVGWHYQPGSQHVDLTTRTLGAALDVGFVSPAAPVAYPDVATTEVNTPVVLDILANDVPALGAMLNPFTVDLNPGSGGRQTTFTDTGKAVFVVDNAGNATVTPVTDYTGVAVASYTVADQLAQTSNSTTITVAIAPPPAHLTLALVAADAVLAIEMHVEGDEDEELAQACNAVFGNDIDDPFVDGGNDTGIHIINAFCYFPEADTAMACSGDPSLVGGTGAVPGPGHNDVYTSSRLGVAVMNPYTSFLGTIDVTAGGNGVCAMTNMCAYDGLLYIAVTTALESDDTVNGPPAIFTVANITDLEEDTYYDTWVEAVEFAGTFSRVGAMATHNGALYVALEPKLPGTDALAIWQYDGATWSLQHSFGTGFSVLRALFGVGAKLYAGVDDELWYATAGTWALADTFTGAVDSLSFKDGLIYVNVRNGTTREIWRGSADDNVFTLFHTFTGETGTLVGVMGTGMPHPTEVEGWLYVPVHEAAGTKLYRWDGVAWTMDHDYGTEFLGVSAMQLIGADLLLSLPRRLHTSDPGDPVPGCEIWAVQCYYPPTWDLFYDVAVVDFTSTMTDEVIPFPPDATWDVTTLVLDDLVFPELDLTLSVGVDGVVTGERTDTSYGGPYTTTYRCDDSLGRHWAGTFAITFTTG